jgi:hypothetical protein
MKFFLKRYCTYKVFFLKKNVSLSTLYFTSSNYLHTVTAHTVIVHALSRTS